MLFRPLTFALVAALPFCGAVAEPFQTRDQNPLLAGYGLPLPYPAEPLHSDKWRATGSMNWSSTEAIQRSGDEQLILDAESREWMFLFEKSLGSKLSVRLRIPYRTTSGGSLDGFIERWHSTFGLPNGDRDALPRDSLRIAYTKDGVSAIDWTDNRSGFGDVSLDAGYRWIDSESTSAALWLSLKLPTGSADELTGSEAFDATAALAAQHHLGTRWLAFGQIAATALGNGELLPHQQRNLVWSSLAGLSWNAYGHLSLTMQVDAHSAVFNNTRLNMLGNAVMLTFGGDYQFSSGWQLALGVSEDVAVETSPDVNFLVSLRHAW